MLLDMLLLELKEPLPVLVVDQTVLEDPLQLMQPEADEAGLV